MFSALKQLWLLCFFRVKPEDMPYSSALAYLAVLLDLMISLPSVFEGKISFFVVLVVIFVYNGVTALVLQWILTLRRQTARFLKMFIALAGTHMLFGAVLLVLSWILGRGPVLQNVMAVLGFWSLVVNSYIFQYGFGVRRLAAIGFAFAFAFATMTPIGMILEIANN